ncbi:MAG TPA: hypothetical protein VFJ82_15905 [Longimicrobium sp.]|nr:hypothetical protein [Longimicrobium sp.]
MPQVPCWSCSQAVYDIASVCPHCGAPLKPAVRENPAPPQAMGPAGASAPPYPPRQQPVPEYPAYPAPPQQWTGPAGAAATPYPPQPTLREYPAPPPQWAGAAGAAAAAPYPYAQYGYGYPAETPVEMAGEFHPLAIHKLVVMSLCTLGLYEVYWFYRNWRRVRERTGESMMPFWRSLFAPLWAYTLFEDVDDEALRRQIQSGWSSVMLAVAFFLMSATWRLPEPFSLISLFSFLPLIPVQNTINQMAARRGVQPNAQFGVWHIAVMLLGALFLVLAAIGSLLPAA